MQGRWVPTNADTVVERSMFANWRDMTTLKVAEMCRACAWRAMYSVLASTQVRGAAGASSSPAPSGSSNSSTRDLVLSSDRRRVSDDRRAAVAAAGPASHDTASTELFEFDRSFSLPLAGDTTLARSRSAAAKMAM